MLDPRAVEILTSTFWGSKGWKNSYPGDTPMPPARDFAYAKAKGLMFDPCALSNAHVLKWCRRGVATTTPRAVGFAFVASLGASRPDLRSALATYAVGRRLPDHPCPSDEDPDTGQCRVCAHYDHRPTDPQDLNVLSFERLKWGGVRHDEPLYIALDLEMFAAADKPGPIEEDWRLLREVLSVAGSLPARASASDLSKALQRIIPGNKTERNTLIEILGICGVLESERRPGFRRRFVPERDRETGERSDWAYPSCWWRGRDGVNTAAVKEWFGPRALTSTPSRSKPPAKKKTPRRSAAS